MRCFVVAACVGLLVLLAPSLTGAQQPAPTPLGGGIQIGPTPAPTVDLAIGEINGTPMAGVAGSSYVSPAFKYTLNWGPAWSVAEATSKGGRDELLLTDKTMKIAIDGSTGFNGDPSACLTASVAGLTGTAGVTGVQVANGASGQPLQGTSAGLAYAVYTFTANHVSMAVYVDCRTVVAGVSVVSTAATAPLASFNAELPLLQTMLATLTLPGAAAVPTAAPTLAATATAGVSADCAGMAAWVQATSLNISAMAVLGKELATTTTPGITDNQDAAKIGALAVNQAGLTVPPAAAAANAAILAYYQTVSANLPKFATALTSGDNASVTTIEATVSQAGNDYASAQTAAKAAAQQCGVTFPAAP